jgi:hypothetical protein
VTTGRRPGRHSPAHAEPFRGSLTALGIERAIQVIRGHRVMLDADLARLFGVETKNLNKAVTRNLNRFPSDFMFRLTAQEAEVLRFQSGTSNGRGGRRYLPYAFTEHGVVMLSNVLASPRAIAVSIEVVRIFVRLRQVLAANADLAKRLDELEGRVGERFSDHAKQLRAVFEAIRQLMIEEDEEVAARIGFDTQGHR